jgi:IS5 family transposase
MSKLSYKQSGRISLFDKEVTSEKLSKLGNPLEKLHKVIDFEIFREDLESAMLNREKKSKAGNKPYDVVMMFKIILLKRFYNLSDAQAKYQINDRLSFKEFLGLSSGDKDHAKIDTKSKLIDKYVVTSAEVHDSQALEALIEEKDRGQELYADSAYTGKPIENLLKGKEIIPQIIERALMGNPLTDGQKESNRIKSKTRCRVEHVFGFVTNSMNDFYIQSIGFKRARGIIGLINLVYNICRYEQIVRLKLLPINR